MTLRFISLVARIIYSSFKIFPLSGRSKCQHEELNGTAAIEMIRAETIHPIGIRCLHPSENYATLSGLACSKMQP